MKRKIRCGGKPVTVIVLAGGRGRRMNADKARLPVRGETLLERVIGQVAPYFSEILVSVSPGQNLRIRSKRTVKGETLRPRIVEDDVPGLGPLGGILAGLQAAANDVCAVVACDIPDVHVPLLRKLARAATEADIAVPTTKAGQFEPLFAVYTKAVIPEIEALLRSGEQSILPLFEHCRAERVPLEDAAWLRNLNTREDYESYLKSIPRK